jgi:hypothetical protein
MAAVKRVTENLLDSGTRKIGLARSNAKPTSAALWVDSAISRGAAPLEAAKSVGVTDRRPRKKKGSHEAPLP